MSRHLLMILVLTMFTGLPVHAQSVAQTPLISTAAETVAIGTLIGREGTVSVITPRNEPHALSAKAPVHLHDVIETGPNSRALIVLIDDTEITLGENAQLSIDDYIFAEDNQAANKARYTLSRGAFLYVSGLATAKKAPDVVIGTPYANIDIRGTTFWAGEIDGAYGAFVTAGQIGVQSDRGRISVDKDTGTTLTARTDVPTRAIPWEQEKIDRALATVTMKDAETVRALIPQNAEVQKAQRETYKTYLAKTLEERKLLKDTRTPSTRIDNIPTPPVAKAPAKKNGTQRTPPGTAMERPAPSAPATSPALEQQLQQLNDDVNDKGAQAVPPAPSGAPKIDLPSMEAGDQPAAPAPARRMAPSSHGKSKAADAL